jgi:hypothetical protein
MNPRGKGSGRVEKVRSLPSVVWFRLYRTGWGRSTQQLGEALVEIQKLSKKYGIRVANVFHAGDGNLHPLILFDGRQENALEQAELLAGEILRMCVDFGGSITGEHGIGRKKRISAGYVRSG